MNLSYSCSSPPSSVWPSVSLGAYVFFHGHNSTMLKQIFVLSSDTRSVLIHTRRRAGRQHCISRGCCGVRDMDGSFASFVKLTT
jgi:hypothetical protein